VEVQLDAFLTSALDGGKWLDSRSGRFTPWKRPRFPLLDRRFGGPQSRSGRDDKQKKIPLLAGNRIPVVHPVA